MSKLVTDIYDIAHFDSKRLVIFITRAKKSGFAALFCSLRLPLKTSIGISMAPELYQDVWRGYTNFQSFTKANNISSILGTLIGARIAPELRTPCSMKYGLISVPGLADVRLLHGDGDGPRTQPRCLEGSEKVSNG